MIATIQKWKVTVSFKAHKVLLWYSDNHISNVLRMVAMCEFTEDPIGDPVVAIEVIHAEPLQWR